jgi:hypothetical protein
MAKFVLTFTSPFLYDTFVVKIEFEIKAKVGKSPKLCYKKEKLLKDTLEGSEGLC